MKRDQENDQENGTGSVRGPRKGAQLHVTYSPLHSGPE